MPNNAAVYSVDGSESDATYLTNGLGRVKLIADRSGNSSANCLVLNAVSGNYASTPDSAALSITDDIDIKQWLAMDDWTPSAGKYTVTKAQGGNQDSFWFGMNTNGTLHFEISSNGSTSSILNSPSAVTFSDLADGWIRATRRKLDGATKFYQSADGVAWTSLGTGTLSSGNGIFDGTSAVAVGGYNSGTAGMPACKVFRTIIANGYDGAGTVVFDADFTAQTKLAATFTESSANAATVTINTTGDLGARICGARDLYQGTTTKMGLLSLGSDGKNVLTFDTSNDFMRCSSHALAQPITDYYVGSMPAWTSGKYFFDGASAANTSAVVMTTTTPQLNINAGSSVAANTDLPVATRGVLTATFNGASSALGVNKGSETTGNANTGTANGSTVNADGAATAANFGGVTFCEWIRRSVVDDAATKARIQAFQMRRWAIPG